MGTTYVSDPRTWKSFYKNMLDGSFHPGRYRGRQSGGGVAGMYSKKPYMIPVNPHVNDTEEAKRLTGNTVTPVAAVEQRAKSEMKEMIEDRQPHVPVKRRRRIKKRRKYKNVISKKTRKASTPKKKAAYSVRSRKTKKTRKVRKRKRPAVEDDNIFAKKRRI